MSKGKRGPRFAAGLGSRPDGPPSGSFHHLCNNKERDGPRVAFCNLSSRTPLPGATPGKSSFVKEIKPRYERQPSTNPTAELGWDLSVKARAGLGCATWSRRSREVSRTRVTFHYKESRLFLSLPLTHYLSLSLCIATPEPLIHRKGSCSVQERYFCPRVNEVAAGGSPTALFGNLPGLTPIRQADGERAQWRRSRRNNLNARC